MVVQDDVRPGNQRCSLTGKERHDNRLRAGGQRLVGLEAHVEHRPADDRCRPQPGAGLTQVVFTDTFAAVFFERQRVERDELLRGMSRLVHTDGQGELVIAPEHRSLGRWAIRRHLLH